MAVFKKATLLTVLMCICFMTSGCATMIGGIIGHQSGEAVAGMAIGAGLDFGGAIINGIGSSLTDQKTHFNNEALLNSENGEIILPKSAFNVDQTRKLVTKLQKKFDSEGMTTKVTMMKSERNGSRYKHQQRISCESSTGEKFDLNANLQKGCDQKLTVYVPETSSLDRSEMTIQVYTWIEEIVHGKST